MSERFYFTFGSDAVDRGMPEFICILAENKEKARRKMFSLFGDKWAFQYDQQQWLEATSKGHINPRKTLKIEYAIRIFAILKYQDEMEIELDKLEEIDGYGGD